MLEINDRSCSGPEERVVFDVTISMNSSEPMEDFTFIVKYDDDILEYVRSSEAPPQTDKVKDWFSGGA